MRVEEWLAGILRLETEEQVALLFLSFGQQSKLAIANGSKIEEPHT